MSLIQYSGHRMSGNLFYSGHKMSQFFQVMGEEISVWEFSFSNGGFLYSIAIIFRGYLVVFILVKFRRLPQECQLSRKSSLRDCFTVLKLLSEFHFELIIPHSEPESSLRDCSLSFQVLIRRVQFKRLLFQSPNPVLEIVWLFDITLRFPYFWFRHWSCFK